jgi:hypothetical protein
MKAERGTTQPPKEGTFSTAMRAAVTGVRVSTTIPDLPFAPYLGYLPGRDRGSESLYGGRSPASRRLSACRPPSCPDAHRSQEPATGRRLADPYTG